MIWNSWFWDNRRWDSGFMSWGSNPREEVTGFVWESAGVNDTFGAALESGLDNSPMYDDMPFDKKRNMLRLADAGLNGALCDGIVKHFCDIASILGKNQQAKTLKNRAESIAAALEELWDKKTGIYLNKNLVTDDFSYRMSPTNFYSLFFTESE